MDDGDFYLPYNDEYKTNSEEEKSTDYVGYW